MMFLEYFSEFGNPLDIDRPYGTEKCTISQERAIDIENILLGYIDNFSIGTAKLNQDSELTFNENGPEFQYYIESYKNLSIEINYLENSPNRFELFNILKDRFIPRLKVLGYRVYGINSTWSDIPNTPSNGRIRCISIVIGSV